MTTMVSNVNTTVDDVIIYSYEEAFISSLMYFGGNELAARVFLDKYALKDSKGRLLEKNPTQTHRRLAREFARIEKAKFKNPLTEDEIYSYLENFSKIICQGSPTYGIGNTSQYVSLSNCFVVASPEDSYGGICRYDEELAQISKRRGGVGGEISSLRPVKSPTKNSSRSSTGIIPFACRFSNTIREVGQDGRRGAEMITCDIRHPESVIPWDNSIDGAPFDVEVSNKDLGNYTVSSRYYNPNKIDFVTCKYDVTKVTGANISLRIPDVFMHAVENDGDFVQQWPIDATNPTVTKTIKAKDAWNKIIHSAWRTAEPGVLFWDTIIGESIPDCYAKFGFKTESTNPCVTSDTWVMTNKGPMQVKDLISNTDVNIVLNGREYKFESDGFFFTGIKKVYKLTTSKGFEITSTGDHLIKTPDGWKELNKLKENDVICLAEHNNTSWEGSNNNESDGYLVGSLIGDGTISQANGIVDFWGNTKEKMYEYAVTCFENSSLSYRSDLGTASADSQNATKYNKLRIKSADLGKLCEKLNIFSEKDLDISSVENTGSKFYSGFLRGWFDADGTIQYKKNTVRNSIRLWSIKLNNLKIAQKMLARLGIISTIYESRNEGKYKTYSDGNTYYCQPGHELVISKHNMVLFNQLIGFSDPQKSSKLSEMLNSYEKRGTYQEKFVDTVKFIEYVGEKDVYDCTVEDVHCFDANGIIVHNCGEIPLSPYDSCRLIAINLFGFVRNAYTPDAYFDYEDFYNTTMIAQRLMDDLVDLEKEAIERIIDKITNDPEPMEIKARELALWKNIYKACIDGRRTGTGITALGDTLAAINIKYGSEKGIEETEQIYKTMKFAAYRSSVDMSKELGHFPIWDHQLEKANSFLKRICSEKLIINNKEISGLDLFKEMSIYGRRNIALLTTAPTGSISILAKLNKKFGTSSGIEPQYSIKPYIRKKKGNPSDVNFRTDSVDQNGDHWMHFKVYPSSVQEWIEMHGEDIEKSPWHNNCAEDLDWTLRVKLQAAAQRHVDHSISSTINLPNNVSIEEVQKIYMTAWKSGCKGVTVYRDGCRTGVLVKDTAKIAKTNAPKRPNNLPCDVYHTTVRGEKFFVIVGVLDNHPYEVFAGKNGFIPDNVHTGEIIKKKRGHYTLKLDNGDVIDNINDYITDEQATITRLASLSLRHGADIKYLVEQLEKTPGDLTNFGRSAARILKKYIPDGTAVSGVTCQNCSSSDIIRQEGCLTCRQCGSSKCS